MDICLDDIVSADYGLDAIVWFPGVYSAPSIEGEYPLKNGTYTGTAKYWMTGLNVSGVEGTSTVTIEFE